jgi:hypothetical protein
MLNFFLLLSCIVKCFKHLLDNVLKLEDHQFPIVYVVYILVVRQNLLLLPQPVIIYNKIFMEILSRYLLINKNGKVISWFGIQNVSRYVHCNFLWWYLCSSDIDTYILLVELSTVRILLYIVVFIYVFKYNL